MRGFLDEPTRLGQAHILVSEPPNPTVQPHAPVHAFSFAGFGAALRLPSTLGPMSRRSYAFVFAAVGAAVALLPATALIEYRGIGSWFRFLAGLSAGLNIHWPVCSCIREK
jgi:hypothetical protein